MIETERLILRPWRPEDAEAYFQINQDPKVIEYLCGPLTMEEVRDLSSPPIIIKRSTAIAYGRLSSKRRGGC